MKTNTLINISISLLILLTACSNSINKQEVVVHGKAGINFTKTEHNFGEIEYAGKATFDFTFVNNGDQPLIINNVKTSCGCTASKYSKKPYLSGKKGEVTVSYDTKRTGKFTKTVYVYTNATEEPVLLKIMGKVKKKILKIQN